MITLRETSINEAQTMWPRAEVHLRQAISNTEDDPDTFMRQLQAKVFSGIHTLWVMEDGDKPLAYAVTVLYSSDGIIRIAQIYMAQGEDLEIFLGKMDEFIVWAIKHDADYIEVMGRKGWERVLRPYGFRHNYTSLVRRIKEELH